jgi:S1-C subfamily serine protease
VQLPEGLSRRLQLPGRLGLVIVNLETDGPAERGGLLVGDILVALEDQELGDPSDLLAGLGPDRIGRPAVLRVIRGGELQTVSVTVGERPTRRSR